MAHRQKRPPFLALIPLLLLMGIGPMACRESGNQSLKTEPVSFTKEGELRLYRAGTDSVLVGLDIELARTEYEIQTGLMYRKDMEDRQGMLFIFPEEGPHSFYMKNTLIPLDILFIDKDQQVVTIHRNARPLDETGIPSGKPVQFVLEIKAGMADRWGVRVGDRIVYETIQ